MNAIQMHPKQALAYRLARAEIGLKEIPGPVDEARIVAMFATVGHAWVKDDETAWCAAAMGAWLDEAGLPHTGALNARSYANWGVGVPLTEAQAGDIYVGWRGARSGWQGHVAFVAHVDHANKRLLLVGGNQSNMVSEQWYPFASARSGVLSIRRMPAPAKPRDPIAAFFANLVSNWRK